MATDQLADLRIAVLAYEAALAQYRSWELAIDEGDLDSPSRSLSRLMRDKDDERQAVGRTAKRVIDEAIKLTEKTA